MLFQHGDDTPCQIRQIATVPRLHIQTQFRLIARWAEAEPPALIAVVLHKLQIGRREFRRVISADGGHAAIQIQFFVLSYFIARHRSAEFIRDVHDGRLDVFPRLQIIVQFAAPVIGLPPFHQFVRQRLAGRLPLPRLRDQMKRRQHAGIRAEEVRMEVMAGMFAGENDTVGERLMAHQPFELPMPHRQIDQFDVATRREQMLQQLRTADIP